MSVILFAGPTLRPGDVAPDAGITVRPPAARGDVLRVAREAPRAICIVDGYFAWVPSVWHKEILWAMSQGIHVFGAGSMGALRAAELCAFGMEGVGAVFEAYRDGVLMDDDEVALVHGSSEDGYRPFSEPMVNVRATLARAEQNGIIPAASRSTLEGLMKGLAYPLRKYATMLRLGIGAGIPDAEIERLGRWLTTGTVDQKRLDALQLVREVSARVGDTWSPKTVDYTFAYTDAWVALTNDVLLDGATDTLDPLSAPEGEQSKAAYWNGALSRALCLEVANRAGLQVNGRAVEAVIEAFRRERGLLEPAAFQAWLERNRLEGEEIVAFFRREAVVRRVTRSLSTETRRSLDDEQRVLDNFRGQN